MAMQNLRTLTQSVCSMALATVLGLFFTQPVRAADDPWKLSFKSGPSGYAKSMPLLIRLSPDGELLAIGCKDNSIRLWDLEAGRELRRLIAHEKLPTSICFSPDGKRIVSASMEGFGKRPFRIWSVATGEQLYVHAIKTESAGGVEYHPSGEYFVVGLHTFEPSGRSKSYSVEAYDSVTFRHQRRFSTSRAFRNRFHFSVDGRRVLMGSFNGYPEVSFDLSRSQGRELPKGISRCVFSPDGKLIAGRQRSLVQILDAASLNEIRRFSIPTFKDNGRPAGTSFRCVRFGPDGRSVFAATNEYWFQWDNVTGKRSKWGRLSYASTGQFELGPNGRRLIELAGANQTILWNVETETPRRLAKLHCLDGDEQWAVETGDGYYQHSDGVTPSFLSSVARNERDEYAAKYHQPKIVARLLRGMPVADALALPENARPPTVSLKLLATRQEEAIVEVVARANTTDGDIRNVSVTVDGRALNSVKSKGLVAVPAGNAAAAQDEQRSRQVLPFPPGRNSAKVRVVVTDSFGQQSDPASLRIERPMKVETVAGRLFVLAVGVSEYKQPELALQFCHADAEALAANLLEQKGRAFGDVLVKVYTNRQATVTNVESGLEWLKRSCTPADVAVVLFSGHGIQKERGLYYLTYEANLNGVQYTCLNWETVAKMLKETQAKQILFLSDTCHAGAFAQAKLAPQQQLAETLREKAGVMVFASSRDEEESREDPAWGHGAFCKAVIEGLDGKGDLNDDGRITVRELQASVTKRVIELTGDQQHPVLPKLGDFDPDLVIANVPQRVQR